MLLVIKTSAHGEQRCELFIAHVHSLLVENKSLLVAYLALLLANNHISHPVSCINLNGLTECLWCLNTLSVDVEYYGSDVLPLSDGILTSNGVLLSIGNSVEDLHIKETIVVHSEYVILDGLGCCLDSELLVSIDQFFHLSLKSYFTFVLPSAIIRDLDESFQCFSVFLHVHSVEDLLLNKIIWCLEYKE